MLFCTKSAAPSDSIIAFVDLETTGLDIFADEIVEIGCYISSSNSIFSTVVRPSATVASAGAQVHGIEEDELIHGPTFAEAFQRFVEFLRYSSLSVIESDTDSDGDDEDVVVGLRGMKAEQDVILAAHNGFKVVFCPLSISR